MKNSIVWLASYPKSGNTWMRIFLANYLAGGEKPISINDLHKFGLTDSAARMYHTVAGREINLQDVPLTVQLRPRVLRGIVANDADINFVKTHNICRVVQGVDLIPADVTRKAIYIIRNPLDVILSYGRHYGMTHTEAVKALGDPYTYNKPSATTVIQFLASWSDHVQSWASSAAFPTLVVRYEDMLEKPEETFGSVLNALEMQHDLDRLIRAIEFSTFDEVSKQEEKQGFKEGSSKTERFFAQGKTGQWKTDLAPDLVNQVYRDHETVMKQYGYYNG